MCLPVLSFQLNAARKGTEPATNTRHCRSVSTFYHVLLVTDVTKSLRLWHSLNPISSDKLWQAAQEAATAYLSTSPQSGSVHTWAWKSREVVMDFSRSIYSVYILHIYIYVYILWMAHRGSSKQNCQSRNVPMGPTISSNLFCACRWSVKSETLEKVGKSSWPQLW